MKSSSLGEATDQNLTFLFSILNNYEWL